MLYTLISDSDNFLGLCFDDEQMMRVIGDLSDDTVDKRIDVNGLPRSYKGIVNEPLILTFPIMEKADKKRKIPDLEVHSGRLFLSAKAYKVLKPLIENDGEFLPATYENGSGYFYIPLRVAEEDAINTELSKENQWNYFDHLVFHEERVKEWSLFRIRLGGYKSLYCQGAIKTAIEDAQLTGLYITNDLANIFPEDRSAVAKVN